MTVEEIVGPDRWRRALADIGPHDFVHSWDFHAASEANGEGMPRAFAVLDDDGRASAFWPVLERPIDSSSFDFGCVYGYGGPVSRAPIEIETAEALLSAMADAGAVTLFSRMHPLFGFPVGLEGIAPIGDVVAIDVSEQDEPPREYRSNHRRNIARLQRDGFTTDVRRDQNSFADFRSIYEIAMDELQASEQYYFSQAYYDDIRRARDFESFIVFAREDGEDVAAVLFTISGEIMQYFLSATMPAFKALAPSKLIIAEAHTIAARRGVRHLVLGGGVGGAQDSLFNFKLGFSKVVKPQHVIRRVLDPERYAQLCAAAGVAPDATGFFPAYRRPRA